MASLEAEFKKLKKTHEALFFKKNEVVLPEILERGKFYEENLKDFFTDFWHFAGSGNDLVPSIAVDAISEHIKALRAGEFKTLLFSMPPREGKSTFISVMLPAFLWAINPRTRFLTSSYSYDYATRDNQYMQHLINSEPYQILWGHKYQITVANQQKTMTTASGTRIATSISGKTTGEGGTWIILDDCLNINDRYSENKMKKTNSNIDILWTRQNMADETKFIMAMHRCSVNDPIGHRLAKNNPHTCYVSIAMEYEIKRRTVTMSTLEPGRIIWEDPRKEEGELASPKRYSPEAIKEIKTEIGKQAYSALYQGLPVMDESSVFKEEWFKYWPHDFMPNFDMIIQCWDTALSTSSESCFSATTVWGVFKDRSGHNNIMLLSLWTGRKEWNDLRSMAIRMSRNYEDIIFDQMPKNYSNPPDYIIVEAQANGLSLIQSLRRAGVDNVTDYRPRKKGDRAVGNFEDAKTIRARLVAPIVESGRVWVPTVPRDPESPRHFAQQFIKGCTVFPSNIQDSRDIVDTFTMAIDWLQTRRLLQTMDDIMGKPN